MLTQEVRRRKRKGSREGVKLRRAYRCVIPAKLKFHLLRSRRFTPMAANRGWSHGEYWRSGPAPSSDDFWQLPFFRAGAIGPALRGYLISGSSALKAGVPALPSHSNTTISVVTIPAPLACRRSRQAFSDSSVRDEVASVTTKTS